MMKLSVVIVSWNTKDILAECLESLAPVMTRFNQEACRMEVIVVDNASRDNSAEAIAENFVSAGSVCKQPDFSLIALSDNRGFAAANNLAIKEAQGDYVLLLNSDTLVLNGAIDKLISFAENNPDAGIWGGRTLFGNGALNSTSCFRQFTPWSLFCRAFGLSRAFANSDFFNSENFGNWQRNTVRHVEIVTGCFLLIKREFWNQLKGFDPRFFMYAEEADLCLRATKQGARPLFTPELEGPTVVEC